MHNFKKGYGQNFLKGSKFPVKLADSLDLTPDDTVIEIGPGDGVLTKVLLDRGCKVISIEIDYDLLPGLIRQFGSNPNFHLVHQDVLKINLPEILKEASAGKLIKVAGSLPYNISKKIINDFINFSLQNKDYKLSTMSFIVQEEVAKEYIAMPPKATFLSSYIRVFADVRKLESIPSEKFYPTPKVNGGILLIKLKENIAADYQEIVKLIKIGFVSPRKTLLRNLKNSNKYPTEKLQAAFTSLGIKENIRPAEMLTENWDKLFNLLNPNSTELK